MKAFRRLRPSPALVVASMALLFALAGTSFAAYNALPRNSVGTLQVKNRSLLALDFKRGQIPAGPQGPAGATGAAGAQGPAGPQGPAGTANIRWAAVRADGGIAASSGNVTLAAKPGAGQYLINFGTAANGKLVLVSSGYAGNHTSNRGETSGGPCGNPPDGLTCSTSDNNNTVLVQTRSPAGVLEDHAFYVAVVG